MRDDLDTQEQIREILLITGEWAGGATWEIAIETARWWLEDGFTPGEVRPWLAARVWSSIVARAIIDAGHDANWAAVMSPESEGMGAYLDTRGYKLCNRDLDLADQGNR